MADLDKQIERSKTHIDPSLFKKLVRLTVELPWLEESSEALAELWNLCDAGVEEDLIEALLRRYTHVDSAHLRHLSKQCAEQICVGWGLGPDDTLIVATSNNSQADGSQMFIQNMKNKFVEYDGWAEGNFCNRVGDSVPRLGQFVNIVLVDDFVGTGNTISRRVAWYKEKIIKKHLEGKVRLFVVSIAGMEFAQPTLNKLGIGYFCPVWLRKGISDFYSDAELAAAVQGMKNIESKLQPKIGKKELPSFGWGESETLFAVGSFNVPNNVFPVFWWPAVNTGDRRKTIFMRLE